jgi:hypothetical protein
MEEGRPCIRIFFSSFNWSFSNNVCTDIINKKLVMRKTFIETEIKDAPRLRVYKNFS